MPLVPKASAEWTIAHFRFPSDLAPKSAMTRAE